MLFCWVQNQHKEWLLWRDTFTCTNCYLWLWLLWMARPQYRKNATKSEAISVKASMSPDHPFSPSAIPQLTASRSLRQQLQEVKIIQVSISVLGLGILKKGWKCRCYVCILMKITSLISLILNKARVLKSFVDKDVGVCCTCEEVWDIVLWFIYLCESILFATFEQFQINA